MPKGTPTYDAQAFAHIIIREYALWISVDMS